MGRVLLVLVLVLTPPVRSAAAPAATNPPGAHGVAQPSPAFARLLTVPPAFYSDSLSCTFQEGIMTTWEAAKKTTKVRDPLTMSFEGLRGMGKARTTGARGSESISVTRGAEVFTILETTEAGTVHLTTVFTSAVKDGSLKAVHSRHVVGIGGAPIVSQFFGSCTAPGTPKRM